MPLTIDAKARLSAAQLKREQRERWLKVRRAEQAYQRALAGVARQVGQLVRGFTTTGNMSLETTRKLDGMLRQYGETIKPWAVSVTKRMHAEVLRRDSNAWEQAAQEMGATLRRQIESAPVESTLITKLAEQVNLITSIPLEAAERVHQLTVRNLITSSRGEELADMILRSGPVAVSRAKTIARTETARTASLLTQVRGEYVGSPGYIWRTSRDNHVRKLHKDLEGEFIPWGKPPISGSNGEHAHAGQIYNCRCYPEVVLPGVL